MLHSIIKQYLMISILTIILPLTSFAREYENRDHYSLESSVQRVKQQTNGRVLSAETSSNEQSSVHQIRVLTNGGKVKRYRIDDQTGQFIPNRREE